MGCTPGHAKEFPRSQPKYMHPSFDSHDIKRNFIQSRLAGAPSDYKDTYFHSRYCVLKDRTNFRSAGGGGVHDQTHTQQSDAWEAAEAHLKNVEMEKERKAEMESIWHRRKVERGQEAAAHLKKIASLEEELAVELAEERERKHQLRLIEDLSKAARASTYKTNQQRKSDQKLPDVTSTGVENDEDQSGEAHDAEFEGGTHIEALSPTTAESLRSQPKFTSHTSESLQSQPKFTSHPAESLRSQPKFTSHPAESLRSQNIDSKEPPAPVFNTGQHFLKMISEVDTEDAVSSAVAKESHQVPVDRNNDDVLNMYFDRPKAIFAAVCKSTTPTMPSTPRKEDESGKPLETDRLSTICSKTLAMEDKSGEAFEGRAAESVRVSLNDAKKHVTTSKPLIPNEYSLPDTAVCPETTTSFPTSEVRGRNAPSSREVLQQVDRKENNVVALDAAIKAASKSCISNAKVENATANKKCPPLHVSNPPNLDSSNNIRKGNKSPHRLASPAKVAAPTADIGRQEPTNKTKELKSRPDGKKLGLRHASDEVPSEKPTPQRAQEIDAPAAAKKGTPKAQSTTWLKYVLEKLAWWKPHKELSIAVASLTQGKAEAEGLDGSMRQLARARREKRKDSTPTFSGRRLNSRSRPPKPNRAIDVRSKISEDANGLNQPERQKADEPGWYEACTKDVFSPEELEALKLELYGTWVDNNGAASRSNAKPKSNKSKAGEEDNVSFQQNRGKKCQSRSLNCSNKLSRRVQRRDELGRDDGGARKRAAKDVDIGTVCKTNVHKTGSDLLSLRVPLESKLREQVSTIETMPSSDVLCKSHSVQAVESTCKAEYKSENCCPAIKSTMKKSAVPDSEVNCATRVAPCDKEIVQAESREPAKSTPARDVADKLIQAWRTGKLANYFSPIKDEGQGQRQKGTPSPRKRRARIAEETIFPDTLYKLKQRENINKPTQGSLVIGKLKGANSSVQRLAPYEQNTNSTDGLSQTKAEKHVWASPKRNLSPFYSKLFQSPARARAEASEMEHTRTDSNHRVEKKLTEARSLDFILGSLSAQVKELDERLRSVTSYATRSSIDEPIIEVEEKTSPKHGEQITGAEDFDTSSLGCGDGVVEHQRCKGEVCNSQADDITLDVRNTAIIFPRFSTGTASSHADRCHGTLRTVEHCKSQAASKESRSRLIVSGQSPVSSITTCLENLTEFVQEMNGPYEGAVPETSCACGEQEIYGSKDLFGDTTIKDNAIRRSAEDLRHCTSTRNSQEHVRQPDRRLPHSSIDLEAAMSLEDVEEQLLSGSVDFSPWNTEDVPDLFSPTRNLERGTNHGVLNCETSWDSAADVDCEGTLRPLYCHVKKESEWLLRGVKFKRKSRAYEKRKMKVKGKQKQFSKKTFNPVALPPRRSTPRKHSSSPRCVATAAVLAKVSTTRIQPSSPLPRVLKFQKKELNLAYDTSSTKMLTTRSLPAQFPSSVSAEEVQKWLCRDAFGCSPATSLPDGPPSRESLATLKHQVRLAGSRTPAEPWEPPEETTGQAQLGTLMARMPVRLPDFERKKADSNKKQQFQLPWESKRRPVSAGMVFKC